MPRFAQAGPVTGESGTQSTVDLKRLALHPPKGLTRKDVLDQLWKEHEQRHAVFWSTYWRWAGILLAAQSAPYLNDALRRAMGVYVIALPIGAMIGSVALGLLLASEYQRLRAVIDALNAFRGFAPPMPTSGKLGWFYKRSIGRMAVVYLVSAVIVVSFVNTWALLQLLGAPQ